MTHKRNRHRIQDHHLRRQHRPDLKPSGVPTSERRRSGIYRPDHGFARRSPCAPQADRLLTLQLLAWKLAGCVVAVDSFAQLQIEGDGAVINVRHGGSGPAVLLLHGFPETHLMWREIAPSLAERFSVVCADLRGYGESSTPASDPDHAQYSKRAMALDMAGGKSSRSLTSSPRERSTSLAVDSMSSFAEPMARRGSSSASVREMRSRCSRMAAGSSTADSEHSRTVVAIGPPVIRPSTKL
ncbi:MAG: hypothetical protein DLM58_19810 [Pseudonocardiales bacterium]|nr:MAG: hypothetical protein DLM58_19810 [Pseudonocardiales bacterium]